MEAISRVAFRHELYQSGYLTIKGYDFDRDKYTLDFPNAEVKVGFMENK